MAGRTFSLTSHLSGFVGREVGSGRHQNASEAVREAPRRYEVSLLEDDARAGAIREGRADIPRGDFTLVRTEDDAADLFAELTGRSGT